ncbi:hypothetical protein MNBD_NITROSPIRAE01-1497 [hydrothermal vent metagenome]|uniref:Uncharacterized protein n=1 Tax=hydrothermal vent metagenome TaxID=652676 RepID=A0A3B1CCL9_9ZZZZ
MKINFTKKEYRHLLDMLDISEWIMTAFETEPSKAIKKYDALHQKILAFSKTMDCEDIIKQDKTLGAYYPTYEYEESEHRQYIENYDEDTFWETLSRRLSHKDLLAQIGEKEYEALDTEERFLKLGELESIYEAEFEKNGVKNLKIEKKAKLRSVD